MGTGSGYQAAVLAEIVRLCVLDRGSGIPEDERARVFGPFHRPAGRPETGEGYGLGFALVRQIARAHGGEARCLAREGGGTVLEVELGKPVASRRGKPDTR